MDDLSNRHKSEKSFFDELAKSRTTAVRLDGAVIERYMSPSSDPVYPKEYMFHLMGDIKGKEILDFGCGEGENSILLAKKGAKVYSFDISIESLKFSKEKARANDVEGRISFCCMAAESLAFKDSSFDMIFGSAILHHLDFESGIKEIRRILKTGGVAIFKEPTVFSGGLKALRDIIPVSKDISPDERQLTEIDLKLLRRHFSEVEITHFRIFARLERFFGSPPTEYGESKMQNARTFVVRCLHDFDYLLLKHLPWLSKFAGGVVMRVKK